MDENIQEVAERRCSLRVDMETEKVIVAWHDSDRDVSTDDGICIDLSRHGMLVEYRHDFPLGALLEITFNPDSDSRHTVKGQVCRITPRPSQRFHIALQLFDEE